MRAALHRICIFCTRFADKHSGQLNVNVKAAIEPAPTDPVQLGHHAKRLLEDPVLLEALERIKGKAATGFMASTPVEADKREAFYRLNWAVQQLETELHVMVSKAQVIEADAERARKAAPRAG